MPSRPHQGGDHQPQPPTLLSGQLLSDLLKRAGDPRAYARWERQVRHARHCTRPVRLAGAIDQVDRATGEARATFDTDQEPDGILLKACGTRRAARCQPCAEVYQADACHLVRAGVAGGKGIPASVAGHPRVFVTFTAPSFGPVHTRREHHAVIRLDGISDDGETTAPPGWATVELLSAAIHQAATAVLVPCPAGLELEPVGWGDQLDIRPITAGTLGEGSEGQVAGYLAKYATKATEALAGTTLDRPIASAAELARLALPEHIGRLVQTCWRLSARPELAKLRLRAWAHQLGYGGHCTTKKSRRYSTTFTRLRAARQDYQQRRAFRGGPLDAWGRPEVEQAAVVLASWTYAGRGYTTLGDALLARSLLENAQEERRIAREELTAVA